jgi:predicted phosphoribosyltransferase
MIFKDRADAGRELAAKLVGVLPAAPASDVVVLGLPRGGVPVAARVAAAFGARLDVIVVRKLGVPYRPELGMGAIGEGGTEVLNPLVLAEAGVSRAELDAVRQRERAELERRARRYRGDRPPVPLAGLIAVVVDDGVATGSTARAACQIVREHGAARVVLAVPVAPPGTAEQMAGAADEFVCVRQPEPFYSIGQFYRDFSPTSDQEVINCLAG